MRLALLLLIVMPACTVVTNTWPAEPLQDYTTPGGLRLHLRGNCLFLADAIGSYLDAAQRSLERVVGLEPKRTRVVVYPWGGLYGKGGTSKVAADWSAHEVRVEWHPHHGARGYPEARVRQAGIAETGMQFLRSAIERARQAGLSAAREGR